MVTRRSSIICLTAMSALLVIGGWARLDGRPAQAAPGVLYVASGDCGGATPCYPTVQAAVDDAQPGDEIRVAAGTYPIQAGSDQVVYLEKSLTLRGGYTTADWDHPDPDTNPTTLAGLAQGRVMVISGTTGVRIEGLRLAYGSAEGLGGHSCSGEWDAGGGLFIIQSAVTLSHTWVMTNSTPNDGFGGGLYATHSLLWLGGNTVVQANYASDGGGLYLNHTQAELRDTTVQGNTAGGAWSGCSNGGGGMDITRDSQVQIVACLIRDNARVITKYGGGILMQGGRLTISDSTIEDNDGSGLTLTAYDAGSDQATAVLSGNTIQNNDGTGVVAGGGSVSVPTIITMTANLIQGNHIDGWGGGLSISRRAAVVGNTIQGNRAAGNSAMCGGGVCLRSSGERILFQGNIVRGNSTGNASGGQGGGIYVTGSDVVLEGNLVQGNSADHGIGGISGSGGGIYIAGNVTLTNNVVTDNAVGGAGGRGAGITVSGAEPTLHHTTVASNTGGYGSGIYVTAYGQPGKPILYNTIIANQAIGVQVNSASPQNLATLYGVLWSGNGDPYSGTVFAFDEVSGTASFVDPAAYDYHVTPPSAAIDAGIDAGVTVDLDGQTRPHYAGYDLGADEWWPLVAIKSVTPGSAQEEDVVTYTLVLTNATAAAMTVTLTDALPPGITYVGPLTYSCGSGSYAAGTITWWGTVLTTTPAVICWGGQVAAGASGTITNTAAVTDAYGSFETDPAVLHLPGHEYRIYLPLVARGG